MANPDYTRYPNLVDVAAMLAAAGLQTSAASLTLADLVPLSMYSDTAVRDWERRTGYIPFLPNSVDVTRYYTPQGAEYRTGSTMLPALQGGSNYLDLKAGLVSVTSVSVGYNVVNPGGATALVQNQDYFLFPENADVEGKPWTMIKWSFPVRGAERSIQIVGKWGYAPGNTPTVPADAWHAILVHACALACPEIGTAMNDGLLTFEAAGLTEKYSSDPLAPLIAGWEKTFEHTLARYRMIHI